MKKDDSIPQSEVERQKSIEGPRAFLRAKTNSLSAIHRALKCGSLGVFKVNESQKKR